MSDENKNTALVPGGVYRREMPDGSVEHATMVSVVTKNGITRGSLYRFGHSPERITEGSDLMNAWTLVSKPTVVVEEAVKTNGKASRAPRRGTAQA